MNYRLYSFVAGLYLSELQKGLQTAHVVSEMYNDYKPHTELGALWNPSQQFKAYNDWATRPDGKTIVILNAMNHGGVVEAFEKLVATAVRFELPVSIFREDEWSMNGMATACGVILPPRFYDVEPGTVIEHPDFVETEYKTWRHTEVDGAALRYHTYKEGSPEYELVSLVKSFRLA